MLVEEEPALRTKASDYPIDMGTLSSSTDAIVQRSQDEVALPSSPSSLSNVHEDDVFVSDTALEAAAAYQDLITPTSVGHRPEYVQIVNDEMAEYKAAKKKHHAETLYKLIHPDPADYSYDNRLVPPPPLNFGTFTAEAVELGEKLLTQQPYQLVKQAVSTDYFFELNDYYMEIAFVGQANAGKSSLINALTQQPIARTSSLPHSTRKVSFYQSVTPEELSRMVQNPNKLVKLPGKGKQLTLVDVPGFGIEGMSDSWTDSAIACTDAYLGTRRSVNTVFLCVDARRGWTGLDDKYLQWIQRVHGVVWILLTKCDMVPHERLCQVMKEIYAMMTKSRGKNFRVYPFILPVSAMTGSNMDQLRALIVETSGLIVGERLRQILAQGGAPRVQPRPGGPAPTDSAGGMSGRRLIGTSTDGLEAPPMIESRLKELESPPAEEDLVDEDLLMKRGRNGKSKGSTFVPVRDFHSEEKASYRHQRQHEKFLKRLDATASSTKKVFIESPAGDVVQKVGVLTIPVVDPQKPKRNETSPTPGSKKDLAKHPSPHGQGWFPENNATVQEGGEKLQAYLQEFERRKYASKDVQQWRVQTPLNIGLYDDAVSRRLPYNALPLGSYRKYGAKPTDPVAPGVVSNIKGFWQDAPQR
jgi:ribosome biogenesis GTP-binding protein YsxC/EngB